jgi:hypothetical protein
MILSLLLQNMCLTIIHFIVVHLFIYLFNFLPSLQNFTIFGYARSIMTDKELRNMISKTLTCRVDKRSPLYFSCEMIFI